MMNILETVDLCKYYGSGPTQVRALDGVSMCVASGEFVAIVGTSGSGKSTLLHMLGGLDRPTSGSVMVDGQELFTLSDEALTIFRRRKIGFVFQAYNLVPVLSVYENIVLPLQLDGRKVDRDYVHEIIATLGLSEKLTSLPNQLSGGQQQRTLLARALCAASKVILLDEPVTGLDPKVTAEFYQVTKDLSEEGIAVIMVSHDVQALDYATHILHMQKKNSFYGTKEEYMNSDKWKLFKNAEENRIGGDKK